MIRTIAVAATFTADPLTEPLSFWIREAGVSLDVKFAPYNQVFQQLLDPTSLLLQNQNGVNVLLIRLEDWGSLDRVRLRNDLENFKEALKIAAQNFSGFYLVVICPPSPVATVDDANLLFCQKMTAYLISEIQNSHNIRVVTFPEIEATYPIKELHDPDNDILAHIPYKPDFFMALGSVIFRKTCSFVNQPFKAIVLDCDGTLWRGACGEVGPSGIVLDRSALALQEFVNAQRNNGMLVCLCSKNNEADVFEVFEQHPQMPLKRESIVASRINWLPKSENIKSLAIELGFGSDAFIFIDDNPVECAEVRSNCPEVLTLQLPEAYSDILNLLEHVWAFDHFQVTSEDKQRTEYYQQNIQREKIKPQFLTFDDFINHLNLQICIAAPMPAQLDRVAELTFRTNQFNTTTIRRSASEIGLLLKGGMECLVVNVIDRFGDYGVVGVIFFKINSCVLEVDTFLLSCRALGRGVEHQMVAKLGEIAGERGLAYVELIYVETKKNSPALLFLEEIGRDFKEVLRTEFGFRIPTGVAVSIKRQPTPSRVIHSQDKRLQSNAASRFIDNDFFIRIANELNTVGKIFILIQKHRLCARPVSEIKYSAPNTKEEKMLCEIWKDILQVDRVGVHDDFFELGGNSLKVIMLNAAIKKKLGKQVSAIAVFEAPTVAGLAGILGHEDEDDKHNKSLLTLSARGQKAPIFFTGSTPQGLALSRFMGQDRPIYGLNIFGIKSFYGEKANLDIEVTDVAERFVERIKSVWGGPYLLMAFCAEAKTALETAQLLQQEGKKVAMLIFLDATWDGEEGRINSFIINLQKYGRAYMLKMIVAQWVLIQKAFLRKTNTVGAFIRKVLRVPASGASQDFRLIAAYGRALERYVVRNYYGNVVLLRSGEWQLRPIKTLRAHMLGKLDIVDVPGFHNDLGGREDAAKVLAEKLTEYLNSQPGGI